MENEDRDKCMSIPKDKRNDFVMLSIEEINTVMALPDE